MLRSSDDESPLYYEIDDVTEWRGLRVQLTAMHNLNGAFDLQLYCDWIDVRCGAEVMVASALARRRVCADRIVAGVEARLSDYAYYRAPVPAATTLRARWLVPAATTTMARAPHAYACGLSWSDPASQSALNTATVIATIESLSINRSMETTLIAAVRGAYNEEEAAFDASANLCKMLCRRGICFVDAALWLHECA